MIPLSLLKKTADLVGGTFLGTLEELAVGETIKSLIADAELGSSLLLAAFEEDPFDAGLAILASTLVIAAIGPEALAAAGTASVVRVVVTEVLGSLVSEEKIIELSTGIAKGLASSSIEATYTYSVKFANKALSLLGGSVSPVTATSGISFQDGSSIKFEAGVGLITSVQKADGTFYNTLIQSPVPQSSVAAGTLTLAQLNLATQIVLKPGSWTGVSFKDSKFSIVLNNTTRPQGAGNGTLSFDPATANESVIGSDGSSFNLPSIGELQVDNRLDGSTEFSVLKSGTNTVLNQVIMSGDATQNVTLASNVAAQTLVLGSGIDTITSMGSKSVIDVGGTFDPGVGKNATQYELDVTNGSLMVGNFSLDASGNIVPASNAEAVSLAGSGFVQTGGTLSSTPGTTSLIVANGVGQTVAGGTAKNIVIAAGTHDTLNASQSGQTLIALGQSGDVLNGQTASTSGLDKLIALDGTLVSGGTVSNVGNDTLNAGAGNNIMIGDGVNTTFNINASSNQNALDVVWGAAGTDSINITGNAAIFVINAPGATLASVENLDLQKLSQQIWTEEGVLNQGNPTFSDEHSPRLPPFFSEPDVFVINPAADDKLVINGQSLSGNVSSFVTQSGAIDASDWYPRSISGLNQINYNVVQFNAPDPNDARLTSWIMGFSPGNFGITNAATSGPYPGEDVHSSSILANGTPTINLANYQTQASGNASGGSGGGSDPSVTDQVSVYGQYVSDTLQSIGAAAAFGSIDTLVAANGADTLTASGQHDTLIGNGAGSTLIDSGGNYSSNVAAYAIDNVTVDLGTFGSNQSATINGSSTSDALVNITEAEALGTNDTLISSRSDSTLTAITAGNTLMGSAGATLLGTGGGSTLISSNGVVWYQSDEADVNLATGTANVGGASTSDTLIGVHDAVVSGSNSTVIGDSGSDTLTAGGAHDTLVAGSGTESLTTFGQGNTLIGGSGTDYLSSSGFDNTLVAGTGADVLSSTGFDTLIGNGAGSQLLTTSDGVAAYTIDNVTIDLGANRATIAGATVSDTLQNITAVDALGSHDTVLGGASTSTLVAAGNQDLLEGGSSQTTLVSNVDDNTLEAGTGQTIAQYSVNDLAVNLGAGTALINGPSASDSLVGINRATVSGLHDTLIGGSVADVLVAEGPGSGDTLIAGSGAETLSSNYGSGNTLIAGSGSDTLSSSGTNDLLLAGDGGSETLSSSGSGNTLIAGAGSDTLSSSGSDDTLLGGSGASVLSASGANDSLIAGTGANTLTATGLDDTLFGKGSGSTLIGTSGTAAIAAYAANDATVNLAGGTARLNGSGTSDTLLGITVAAALGSNDTLIGTNSSSTLYSDAAGNTLIGGAGETVAAYSVSNVTVNLSAEVAAVNGSSVSDTLIGIVAAAVSGSQDTVVAGSGANVISSSGSGNTLIAGTGLSTLSSSGTGDILLGGSGADTLVSSGTDDTLFAGSAADILSSSGSDNSLVAGTGIDTLSSSGSNDTLFGNGAGSTLNGSGGSDAVVAYTANDVTVNLATGAAGINGSNVGDTLIGFATAAALGSSDTLIDGNNGSTLFSDAAGNTLVGGTGRTVAAYSANDLTIDLSAGTVGVNGSGVSDTLIGIEAAAVSGANDTLLGGSGNELLSSSGSGNTLIAGSGIDTLSSTGNGDTLFGNLLGSTLQGTLAGLLAVYTANNATIDLSAGTAQANGSNVSDQLIGIGAAEALGSNDTLIGGSTLISDANGNTLMAGTGDPTALYEVNNLTVNLIAGTASISGASATDKLIGIFDVTVSGDKDTIISGGTGDTLVAGNASDVVAYAVNNMSVDLLAGTAGVNGTNAEDRLTGFSNVVVSGTGDSATGGMTSGSMTANGSNDILIAGASSDMMIAAGSNDTLAGNLAGSTLEAAGTATGTVALYTYDDVTVDLGAGTARSPISNANDTLIGITAVTATGSYDALLAGSGVDTLTSSGSFNSLVGGSGNDTLQSSGQSDTLIAGSGNQTLISRGVGNTLIAGSSADVLTGSGTGDFLVGNALGSTLNGSGDSGATAVYTMDNVKVDLATGTAGVNGSSLADSLIGIANATVSGTGDTAIAGSGISVLSSDGSSNTLIGGAGTDTLSSSGSSDILLGGSGTDLITSSGSQNSLVAGGGTDVLASSGTSDVLLGGAGSDSLSSSGTGNTLVAGSGADILSSTGVDDTLFGNDAGSTLIGSNGVGTVAAYALNNVTVNLATGTATVNGSGVSDRLQGIASVLLTGSNDTVIGGTGATALISDAAGNTLEAGTGQTTVVYTQDDATVDLATSSATINGSNTSDTLIGITDAIVSGTSDTLIGNNGNDVLSSNGSGNTVIAGSGTDTLSSSGSGNTLMAGSGTDILSSSGQGNELVAGSGIDSLTSTGYGDVLIGNAAGSILEGANGFGAIAAYTTNDVTVDLATGTAAVNGSGTSDTLLGIAAAEALGTNDTLIGGSGATTLLGNGAGNSLVAGAGQTTVLYAQDSVTVDLATSSATVNGSGTSDTLVRVTDAAVAGSGDTLIGGGANDVLSSSGEANTLIAGTGAETLSSSGFGDTLVGNAAGSTLDGTSGNGTIAAYAIDDVTVDLTAGTATAGGSGVSDALLGITSVLASGSDDTLIGGANASTLYGNASGNTLVAGAGQTTAAYAQDDVSVDLVTSSASVSGSSTSDTLIGITNAAVLGTGDTITGSVAGDVLSAGGTNDTLLAGSGAETLESTGSSNTLIAGNGNDSLASSGSDDSLVAGTGADVLSSSGFGNILIAGTGSDSLISTGFSDTLYGNSAGSALDGSGGTDAVAAYTLNNVVVDLTAGRATVSGSGVNDTLVGIDAAAVSGSGDTIIGNSGADVLSASGSEDVVFASSGADTLIMTSGTNTFVAGAGNDTFVVQSAATVDGLDQPQNLIGSFNSAHDTIDLTNITGVSSFGELSFSTVTYGEQSYLQVALGSTGESITLSGVSAADLTANNFVFQSNGSAPTVTITSAAEAGNVASQTITGTVASGGTAVVIGQTVTLTDNGTTLGTATVQSNGTFSAAVTLPNQGTNSVVATVTDSDGNTGSSAAVVDTLDDVAPSVTITSTAEASDVARQTISGTVTSGGAAAVAGQIVTLTDNGTSLATVTVQANGTFSAAVTLPNQGSNSIVATVTDSYGNTGSSSAIVDALDAAPTVTISSAAEASNIALQNISGTVVSGGAAAVAGQTVTLTDNGTTLGTATVQSNGTFSTSVTLPDEGGNSIVASVTDSLGDTGSSSAVVDTLDNIAPTVTISSAIEASNVASQTISGTVTSGGTAAVIGQAVTLTDNGTTLGTATVQSNGSFSAAVTLPNQGSNSIVATVTDSYGNTGASTAVVDTLDNVAPTVTITSAAETSNVAAQTITGTVATGGAAAVVGQTVTLSDDGTTLGTATVQANGSFSAAVTLPNQGSNSIVATVTDSYGNTGRSAAVIDTLDNVALAVTIGSAAEASKVVAQTITGTVASGGATVVGRIVTLTDNGRTLGTAVVQANGTFSAAVTLPDQGTNSLVATTTDNYGNTSSSAAVVDTLDNVAPTVTLTSGAEESSNSNQTIIGTVRSGGAATVVGQNVTLTDNGTVIQTATVLPDGSFTTSVALPNGGANSIVATVSDSYGNAGSSAAVVDTLDSGTGPSVAITSEVLADDTGASSTDYVTSDGQVTLAGSVSSDSTVTVFDGSADLGNATLSGTNWSFAIDLPDGTHQLYAVATGPDGATTSSAPAQTIVVESGQQPAVTVWDPFFTGANEIDLALGGTSEPDSVVQVFDDGTILLGTTTTSAAGSWGLDIAPAWDGHNSFSVVATDLAGNVSTYTMPSAVAEAYYAPEQSGGGDSGTFGVPWQEEGVTTLYVGAPVSDTYLQADSSGNLSLYIQGDSGDSAVLAGDLTDQSGVVESGVGNIVFSDGTDLNLNGPLTFTWLANGSYDTLTGAIFGSNVYDITAKGAVVDFPNDPVIGATNVVNYAAGSGFAQIDLDGGTGEIDFGSGITVSGLFFEADSSGDLTIGVVGSSDTIEVNDDLVAQGNGTFTSGIDKLQFSDGSVEYLGSSSGGNGPLTFTWFANGSYDTLPGSGFGSNVYDIAANRAVVDFPTNPAVSGTNVVKYAAGSGFAQINLDGGTGEIDFGAGITASDLFFEADSSGDLTIGVVGNSDTILVNDDLVAQGNGTFTSGIEKLRFSDGTVEYLGSSPGENGPVTFTWFANGSYDTLPGSGFGSNVYDITANRAVVDFPSDPAVGGTNVVNYAAGSGFAQIGLDGGTGEIDFGAGIAASNLFFEADSSGDLTIGVIGSSDTIVVNDDLVAQGNGAFTSGIDKLSFSDGTVEYLGSNPGESGPLTFTWFANSTYDTLPGSGFGSNIYDITAGRAVVDFPSDPAVAGTNVVNYAAGSGLSQINLNGGTGEIDFGTGITESNLFFQADSSGDLTIGVSGSSDTIVVNDDLVAQSNGTFTSGIDKLQFSDGTVEYLGSSPNGNGPLTFTWFANSTYDTLAGSGFGSNIYDITAGRAVVDFPSDPAVAGTNVVNYAAGSGLSQINLNGGTGEIDFGSGITASNLFFQADGSGDLTIAVVGSSDTIVVNDDLVAQSNGTFTSGIDKLQFSDGTVEYLGASPGGNGPLTFTWFANGSYDTLVGSGFGSNVYDITANRAVVDFPSNPVAGSANIVTYAVGSGNAEVNPNGGTGTIDMGAGLTASDVYLQADNSGDLIVGIDGDPSDTITVNGDLADTNGTVTNAISQIQFTDGSSISLSQATPPTFTWIGAANASLQGSGYGANLFELGPGNESATGGTTSDGGNGNNTYVVSSNTGQATINANASPGSTNELDFVGEITDENLWFQQSGNDLKIDLLGTNTQVDIAGWFNGSGSQLQEITAGGLKIDGQISQLVQAMATYSANNTGFDPTSSSNSAIPNDSNLQNAIGSAWHS